VSRTNFPLRPQEAGTFRVKIAEETATADILSDGLLEFRVGRGVAYQCPGYGIPLEESRERFEANAVTPGAVSRRDNAAMGPNNASPSPRPRPDSYGPAHRDARDLFVRLFLPG